MFRFPGLKLRQSTAIYRLNALIVMAVLITALPAQVQNTGHGKNDHSSNASNARRTVSGYLQARPGGPRENVKVAVYAAPSDLPSVTAEEAALEDQDLVLGVRINGRTMAYPIRYIATYEVIDDRVGETPLAPTW